MNQKLGTRNIVLLGVGHTNAHVLRMWKMGKRPRNSQLICVSDFPVSTYSGMLPGVLAGQYPVESMQIDLVRLTQSAGARLIVDRVTGLDRGAQKLRFADRPPLPYDVLSIGVGSRPSVRNVQVDDPDVLIAIKPMQTFLARLRRKVDSLRETIGDRRMRICVVGGGIGSLEIAFGLRQRFAKDNLGDPEIRLVTSENQVGRGLAESTQQKLSNQLRRQRIAVSVNSRVSRVEAEQLVLCGGGTIGADLVVWSTGAVAHDVFAEFGLEQDERGFLLTRSTLQAKSDDRVFVVGDSGTIEGENLDKAGVFAVRQGPVLTENIRLLLDGRTLTRYEPQRRYLKIVNVGDGTAISEHYGRSWYGRSQWWLKNRIDVKFMKMYQDYRPMKMKPEPALSIDEMRCLGCGGKVGGAILSGVMDELGFQDNQSVIVGLEEPDDAAVIRTKQNQVTVSTDFFASPVNDLYITGRIAALNSLSDLFVMGAQPTTALTIVQLPEGHPRAQSRAMYELMAGAKYEMDQCGTAIVGGHTIEGPRVLMGFTVLGDQIVPPSTKSKLQVGDRLILSKPIGSGVMLAACMQSQLPGEQYLQLLDVMLKSNAVALDLMSMDGISAMTDVTGFGLAGHLLEMLTASRMSARVQLASVATIPGAVELVRDGFESTLTPENRWREPGVQVSTELKSDPIYQLLFDPQTCGGLLLGVAPAHEAKVLEILNERGFAEAVTIGEVIDDQDSKIHVEGDRPSVA